ncbi:MAG: DUF3137 domain-containing protein [Bacteroidia bacterium]|nr:DUF3137 domain-containing protein [Bacteroidia bacterium]
MGSKKRDAWTAVADRMGAEFTEGGFWRNDTLCLKRKNWTIYLDTFMRSTGNSSYPCTRIRAPYISTNNLQFRIYEENILSPVSKWLGLQDIQVGNKKFDHRYMIKGNDEHMIRKLFEPQDIKTLMLDIRSMAIRTKDKEGYFSAHYAENADLIYFEQKGIINKEETLSALLALFCLLLDRLVEIGAASEEDPKVNLD